MVFRRVVVASVALIVGLACSAGAQSGKPGPGDTVDNPPFANWAQFKPGTTVTQKEVVSLPDGRKLEQVITYKLLRKSDARVVVESTVKDKIAGMGESTRTVNTSRSPSSRWSTSSPVPESYRWGAGTMLSRPMGPPRRHPRTISPWPGPSRGDSP